MAPESGVFESGELLAELVAELVSWDIVRLLG
jgi:hypothetical protein